MGKAQGIVCQLLGNGYQVSSNIIVVQEKHIFHPSE